MSEPYVGEIRIFAGSYAPRSWAFCEGQTLPVSTYDALYALLGTNYGGDGITNFCLPDLRGRIPIGEGTGHGLTPRRMGEYTGVEQVRLTETTIPTHNHVMAASLDRDETIKTTNPTGALFAQIPDEDPGKGDYYKKIETPDDKMNLVDLGDAAVEKIGSNQLHENRMPFLCINYIIALQGVFPPRS